MMQSLLLLALVVLSGSALALEPTTRPSAPSPLGFVVKDIAGNDYDLSQLRGKVVVIVNVASRCGMTPQYAALEAMYRKHRERGLVVVGFPANNFGGQEPGTDEQIRAFCSENYDVTFPMMSKISVKGDDKHPLYAFLTSKETAGEFAGEVQWNFTKFVIGRDGTLIGRFAPNVKPTDAAFVALIESALGTDAR
jgi:glutathione peroxidase